MACKGGLSVLTTWSSWDLSRRWSYSGLFDPGPPLPARARTSTEDAAEGLKGVQPGGGAAAHVADGIGAAGGEQREAAAGDAGAVDQLEQELP